MYGEIFCVAVQGIEGCMIRVEADVSDGLPCFSMVGFLSSEVKEARERVCIAIKNCGIRLPPKKITVNLSPADIRKAGTGYDLAIAVAILTAFGYLPQSMTKEIVFIGELSLDGCVKPVDGILPMVYAAYQNRYRRCIVPADNLCEARVVEGIMTVGVASLTEVVELVSAGDSSEGVWAASCPKVTETEEEPEGDGFSEVRGQQVVKRAVEVAAAGRHNLLMVGPPGTGKTMLAKRISQMLPQLSFEEQMEISKIYSVSGLLSKDMPLVMRRPFRAPHHTITQTALVGGGRFPKPGEVSLASAGVLFLDELPEFNRQVVEVLRQPLEDGFVTVSRLEGSCRYPARCQLVAAMNPCRCGYYPDRKRCLCTPLQVKNYLNRISRPLLERIDICAETVPLEYAELSGNMAEESAGQIHKRIQQAHLLQQKRYAGEEFCFNAQIPPEKIPTYCRLTEEAQEYLQKIFEELSFSARVYHKLLRVGRTIADLEEEQFIGRKHISEAVCYRVADRKFWGDTGEAGWL